MSKYLDDTGLKHLWSVLKNTFALKNHTHDYAIKLVQYKSTYIATGNVSTIPINISQYRYGVDILEVYINGMRLDNTEYTNTNSTNIILTKAIEKGCKVHFIVNKGTNS
jgi:hypothetical protein